MWTAHFAILPSLLVCALYAACVIAARWLLVARPTRKNLEARIDELSARLSLAEASAPSAPAVASARELLTKADRHLKRPTPFYWFIWNGENELAGGATSTTPSGCSSWRGPSPRSASGWWRPPRS